MARRVGAGPCLDASTVDSRAAGRGASMRSSEGEATRRTDEYVLAAQTIGVQNCRLAEQMEGWIGAWETKAETRPRGARENSAPPGSASKNRCRMAPVAAWHADGPLNHSGRNQAKTIYRAPFGFQLATPLQRAWPPSACPGAG